MALDGSSFAVGPATRLQMTFRPAEAAIAFAARRGWRYEMGGSDAAAPGKR
jgi:hypothetical protein